MRRYFRTLDEQIKILSDRGLIIEDEENAKTILLRYNYYKIVNATSKFFTEKKHNQIIYRKNTNFGDLIDVHNFDKEIKKNLLTSMIEIERIARSIISYLFVQKYPEEYAYLDAKNYNNENKVLILSNIDNIKESLKRYQQEENFNRSIQYYVEKYKSVPFWFVVNFISFGKLVNIYETLDYKLKEDIADEFQLFLEENLGRKIEGYLTPKHLLSFLNNAKEIRNISAHDNLIIDYKFSDIEYFEPIHSIYNIEEDEKRESLFDGIMILKALLPKKEYEILENQIFKEIEKLRQNVDSIAFNKIIKSIGLDKYIGGDL